MPDSSPPPRPQTTANPSSVLSESSAMSPALYPRPALPPHGQYFKLPKLRFEVRDISHNGAHYFFSSVNPVTVMESAVHDVLKTLYESESNKPPPTRSITLILRSMPGVAYTTGSELDNDHKEIHFSLDYIANIAKTKSTESSRIAKEIQGVVTHEAVHCYQFNGKGACPGGLIEGIADWVRLRAYLSPPHWKRDTSMKWDAGYQHTAYFLDYLEDRFGEGTVRRINEKLRDEKYYEETFWWDLFNSSVKQLWIDYTDKYRQPEKADESKGQDEWKVVSRTSPEPLPKENQEGEEDEGHRVEEYEHRMGRWAEDQDLEARHTRRKALAAKGKKAEKDEEEGVMVDKADASETSLPLRPKTIQ